MQGNCGCLSWQAVRGRNARTEKKNSKQAIEYKLNYDTILNAMDGSKGRVIQRRTTQTLKNTKAVDVGVK